MYLNVLSFFQGLQVYNYCSGIFSFGYRYFCITRIHQLYSLLYNILLINVFYFNLILSNIYSVSFKLLFRGTLESFLIKYRWADF